MDGGSVGLFFILAVVAIIWWFYNESVRHRKHREKVQQDVALIAANSSGLTIDNRKRAVDYMWTILEPVHTVLGIEALVVVYLSRDNAIIYTDVRFGDSTSVSFPPSEIESDAVNHQAK